MPSYVKERITEIKANQASVGTRQGYVYFIGKGDKVKIGFTGDVEGRLSALQTASPERLSLLQCLATHIESEALLHEHFAADRLAGEWFTMTPAVDDLMGDVFDYQGRHWFVDEPEELTEVFIPVSAVKAILESTS